MWDDNMSDIAKQAASSKEWKNRIDIAIGTPAWAAMGEYLKAHLEAMDNGRRMDIGNGVSLLKESRLDGTYRVLVETSDFDRQDMFKEYSSTLKYLIRVQLQNSGRDPAVDIPDGALSQYLDGWIDNRVDAAESDAIWYEDMLQSHGFETSGSKRVLTPLERKMRAKELDDNFKERIFREG